MGQFVVVYSHYAKLLGHIENQSTETRTLFFSFSMQKFKIPPDVPFLSGYLSSYFHKHPQMPCYHITSPVPPSFFQARNVFPKPDSGQSHAGASIPKAPPHSTLLCAQGAGEPDHSRLQDNLHHLFGASSCYRNYRFHPLVKPTPAPTQVPCPRVFGSGSNPRKRI